MSFLVQSYLLYHQPRFYSTGEKLIHKKFTCREDLRPWRSAPRNIYKIFILNAAARFHDYGKLGNLHKNYVRPQSYPQTAPVLHMSPAKVFHNRKSPFCGKSELYTDLSTLSTIFLCGSPSFSTGNAVLCFLFICHKLTVFDKFPLTFLGFPVLILFHEGKRSIFACCIKLLFFREKY